jgi:hypothetical protein
MPLGEQRVFQFGLYGRFAGGTPTGASNTPAQANGIAKIAIRSSGSSPISAL